MPPCAPAAASTGRCRPAPRTCDSGRCPSLRAPRQQGPKCAPRHGAPLEPDSCSSSCALSALPNSSCARVTQRGASATCRHRNVQQTFLCTNSVSAALITGRSPCIVGLTSTMTLSSSCVAREPRVRPQVARSRLALGHAAQAQREPPRHASHTRCAATASRRLAARGRAPCRPAAPSRRRARS